MLSRFITIGFIIFLLSGCTAVDLTPAVQEKEAAAVETVVPPTETVVTASPSPQSTPSATAPIAVTTPDAPAGQATETHGPALQPVEPAPTAVVTQAAPIDPKQALAEELAQAVPPPRDDVRLAAAYLGLDSALAAPVPAVMEPLSAGARETFQVLDVVNNRYGEIEAELLGVGEHAYFWFERSPTAAIPDEELLADAITTFDEIHASVTAIFGEENSPGIDGDPRLHVLHASPQTICGLEAGQESGCGTAGFVSATDLQPAALNPWSNEREMFVMNDRQFGGAYYLGVLAHEFRHLIESNYDHADTDWEKEGSAVLAAQLAGQVSSGPDRANAFLGNPDQQLNSWPDNAKGSYYGQGYLFNRYLYDRLGEDLYRAFAVSPLPGFVALDRVAEENNLPFSGESLWLDWLAALILHDDPQAEGRYQINVQGLTTAALLPIDDLPAQITADVRQQAADYYQLPAASARIHFSGSQEVPLLAGQGSTDGLFWLAQRANYSNPRLTRTLDLRGVETASLVYDVYADIEHGYDFAYVSLSTDGGQTWLPLQAPHMQGLDPLDDPSQSALAPRFYTGRTQAWQHEIIDLTPFAGQEVDLRFEMVTDPILTYSGLAVDNIAVPEIGFFDDGRAQGWTAEGFTLAEATLPQTWHLRLIEYTVGGPVLKEVPVDEQGTAEFVATFHEGQARPVLIVAAAAPLTLEPAVYALAVSAAP